MGIAECSGEAVGFLKCGDRLAPDALFHAMSGAQDGLAGLIYTDEDEFEFLVIFVRAPHAEIQAGFRLGPFAEP